MFQATFLGWQGWLFASDSVRVLADPLFLDQVGRGPRASRARFLFWPPRRFSPAALPPIDAVWLTHEHEDHFDIPTLARLDRRIPLLMSALMSTAARTVVREMGFTTTLVEPGEAFAIGDLRLTTYATDQARTSGDEWDVLPYLVHDAGGDGAFFTNVDVAVTPAMLRALGQTAPVERCETVSYNDMLLELWRFSAHRARAKEGNHRAPASGPTPTSRQALAHLRAGTPTLPLPGWTVVWRDRRIHAIEPATPFLTVAEPPWGARERFWPRPDEAIDPPVSGIASVDAAGLAELEAGLDELAGALYGGRLFRALLSLDRAALGGRRPTFLLRLLDDAGARGYEYQLQGCRFARRAATAGSRYVGVVTLWAGDLLALLRGQIEPRRLVKSTRERWRLPDGDEGLLTAELWTHFHPLRRPRQVLAQYRRIAAEEAQAPRWARAAEWQDEEAAGRP